LTFATLESFQSWFAGFKKLNVDIILFAKIIILTNSCITISCRSVCA
jgi:hypothetical protein